MLIYRLGSSFNIHIKQIQWNKSYINYHHGIVVGARQLVFMYFRNLYTEWC